MSRFDKAIALVAVAGAFLVIPAKADTRYRHSKTVQQSDDERYVVVTGSYLPQKVKVRSIGTDSMHNVRIYTQEELRSTGRPTLPEALALDPSIQITGRR